MIDPAAHPLTETREIRRYCDDLLLALRMQEVPGQRIGEVITEVRAHLADSGEDPVTAFGAPEEYAASFAADRGPASAGQRFRECLTAAGFGLGGWWLADGVIAMAIGDRAVLGPLPLAVAVLAGVGGPWVLEQVVSSSRARMLRGVLAMSSALAVLTAAGLLLDDRLGLSVPAAVPVVLGLVCLVAGTLGLRGSADPVVDPFDPPADVAKQRRRAGILVDAALWGWLLFLVAVAVGVAVLIDRLG